MSSEKTIEELTQAVLKQLEIHVDKSIPIRQAVKLVYAQAKQEGREEREKELLGDGTPTCWLDSDWEEHLEAGTCATKKRVLHDDVPVKIIIVEKK